MIEDSVERSDGFDGKKDEDDVREVELPGHSDVMMDRADDSGEDEIITDGPAINSCSLDLLLDEDVVLMLLIS